MSIPILDGTLSSICIRLAPLSPPTTLLTINHCKHVLDDFDDKLRCSVLPFDVLEPLSPCPECSLYGIPMSAITSVSIVSENCPGGKRAISPEGTLHPSGECRVSKALVCLHDPRRDCRRMAKRSTCQLSGMAYASRRRNPPKVHWCFSLVIACNLCLVLF